MRLPYTLEHNRGEVSFESLRDAIMAMYVIADYDKDCQTTFSCAQWEIDYISKVVESGNYYNNGTFCLFKSE